MARRSSPCSAVPSSLNAILSIDGNGLFLFQSTLSRDLPVIQFLAIYTATVVVLVNLVVDLSYALADPRVKYS